MEPKFTAVLIQTSNGRVYQTDILLDAGGSMLSSVTAHLAGFTFDKRTERWTRADTDEMIEEELKRSGYAGLPWRRITDVERESIHADRTFRNALTINLTIDMAKAREIHKDKLRRDRAPLLAALDLEANKLITKPDANKAAEIEAAKQVLRDVTERPEIETAKTPEELKAITI